MIPSDQKRLYLLHRVSLVYKNNFHQIYVLEQDAVNIRLKEQIANGNIQRNDDGNFNLTKKGEITSQIMLATSHAFNVNTAYIEQ